MSDSFNNMTEFHVYSPEGTDNDVDDLTVVRIRRLISNTHDETRDVYTAVLESYLSRRIAVAWRDGTMVYLPINNNKEENVRPRRRRVTTKSYVGRER